MKDNNDVKFDNLLKYLGELDGDKLNLVFDQSVSILTKREELTPELKERLKSYRSSLSIKYENMVKESDDSFKNAVKEAKKVREADYQEKINLLWKNIKHAVDIFSYHLMSVDGFTIDELEEWTFGIWKSNEGEKRVYLNDGKGFEKDTVTMGVYYVNGNINNYPRQLVTKKHVTVPLEIFEEVSNLFDDELPLKRFGDMLK